MPCLGLNFNIGPRFGRGPAFLPAAGCRFSVGGCRRHRIFSYICSKSTATDTLWNKRRDIFRWSNGTSGCVGKQQSYTFDGQSCLADPEGNLCCVCGDAPELAFVTVENDTEQFRRAFPTCRDVKLPFYTELYQNLVREEEHQ